MTRKRAAIDRLLANAPALITPSPPRRAAPFKASP